MVVPKDRTLFSMGGEPYGDAEVGLRVYPDVLFWQAEAQENQEGAAKPMPGGAGEC